MSTRNFLILVGSILVVLFILLGIAINAENASEEDVATNEENTEDQNTEESNDQEEEADSEGEETEQTDSESPTMNINEGPLYSLKEGSTSAFGFESGVDIPYPEDGVKGVYVTAYSAGGDRMQSLIDLINNTELNSMVLDVKEDIGDIMMELDTEGEESKRFMQNYVDGENLMQQMEENDIYPIGRIVVFKDSRLAQDRPDLSFVNSEGSVWQNESGESFVNPFLKEVWDYNVDIAIEAAKLGFKEIQFDYVRFPEAFETMSSELQYSFGDYADSEEDEVQQRVSAVTDFVAYAKERLEPYGVEVSVDVFGYAATQREAPGIGQNFSQISNNVDVISSMIYPSHWGAGAFGYDTPDTEPYGVIDDYMKVENEVLGALDDPPKSRPWIQDFTASYLGLGNYLEYGPAEVEAQIQALNDNGVEEYLIWNSSNDYSTDTNY